LIAQTRCRILILDWAVARPHVREFLAPFEVDSQPPPRELAEACRPVLGIRTGDTLSLRRYAMPGAKIGALDLVTIDSGTRQPPKWEDDGFRAAVAQLRKSLQESGYDYVFVNLPDDSSEGVQGTIALLCDVAVVCFLSRDRLIAQAGELAIRVRDMAPVGITVLPLATLYEPRPDALADRTHGMIHQAFGSLIDEDGPLRLPKSPNDSFEPLLTILAEEPDSGSGLTAAYERLARTVTSNALGAVLPIPQPIRARYRRAFDLDPPEPDRIVVAYSPVCRPWAEWVSHRLAAAGTEPRYLADAVDWLAEPGPVGLVVIGDPDDEGYPAAEIEQIRARRSVVVYVRADGEPPVDHNPVERSINVSGLPADQAANRLLACFGLVGRPLTATGGRCRYPLGEKPELPRFPAGPEGLAGREPQLLELREALLAGNDGERVAISGVAGVGKSVLAAEYVDRFAYDYDRVWWIPAHDRQAALTSLFALSVRLKADLSDVDAAASVLDVVGTAAAAKRMLLVYDNADDIAGLADLIPAGAGLHVVFTTTQTDVPAARVITLEPLPAATSVRLLQKLIRGLPDEDAQQIAQATGHLPLALELAAASLGESITRLRNEGRQLGNATDEAADDFGRLPAEHPGRSITFGVVAKIKAQLATTPEGKLAVAVAELCAFLSPRGVSLDVIRSPMMLEQVSASAGVGLPWLAIDVVEIDRVLWIGAKSGLFAVDWGEPSAVRSHRLVQASLRDAMSEADRVTRNEQALKVLAAYAPMEMDRSKSAEARYAELQRHVLGSRAMHSHNVLVRRWLVNQLRYLYLVGNVDIWRAAIEPAHEALAEWAVFGQHDILRGQLATQLANIYRSLGRNEDARVLDEKAMTDLRHVHPHHPRALIAGRGLGGDLRGLGLFKRALVQDQMTWQGLRDSLGEDHPHTRSAANNLSLTMYLAGNPLGALELETDNFDRRLRLFGPGHLDTWFSQCNIGVYLRELGQYDASLDALDEARARTQDVVKAQRLGNISHELRIWWQFAVTERRMGRTDSAKQRNSRAARGYQELEGSNHPDTIACELSLSVVYRLLGDVGRALELAWRCERRLREEVGLVPDHPFMRLCQLTLGLHLRAAGRHGDAFALSKAASEGLAERLEANHPWTLAAVVNHACDLAISGHDDKAVELLQEMVATTANVLVENHPFAVHAAHNLDVATRRQAGVPAPTDTWRGIDIDIPQT
jgi:tetratricopeptide (TPR) repeat protein